MTDESKLYLPLADIWPQTVLQTYASLLDDGGINLQLEGRWMTCYFSAPQMLSTATTTEAWIGPQKSGSMMHLESDLV